MLDARSVQIFASLSSSSVMRRPITRKASAVIFRTIFSSFVLSGPNAHPKWANCFRHSSLAESLRRVCSGLRDRKESVAICAAAPLELGWIQNYFQLLGGGSLLSALSW